MLQSLVDATVQACVLSLLALSLTLTWGTGRFANVAHVQYATVGAYLALALSAVVPGGLATAVVVSVLATTAVGGLLQYFVLRRLASSSASTALIGSLALGIVIVAGVQTLSGPQPKRMPIRPQPGMILGDIIITQNTIVIASITVVALLAVFVVLRWTKFGHAVRYVMSNQSLAGASGINVRRTTTTVFAAAAGLAALAGILVAIDSTVNVTMGDSLLLSVFAATILGGVGRPWGAVVAAVGLAVMSNLLLNVTIFSFMIPLGYRPAIGFLALILVLLFRPEGLFSPRRRYA